MAKTGHPNFVYKISSAWRTQRHTWSLTGNHSGSSLNGSQAETFLTGAASPFALSFAPFLTKQNSGGDVYADLVHQVVGVAYYDGINSAPVYEADYNAEDVPSTNLLPTGTAYASGTASDGYGSLEACAELRAQVGFSKTNKPIYVRKYVHGLASTWVSTNIDGVQAISLTTQGVNALESLNNGTWYNGLVYISPSGSQPVASAWQVIPGAHQMPRGRRKVSAAKTAKANSTLLSLLESGALAVGANLLADAL